MNATTTSSVLVVRAGARTCALSLQHVLEIMRPLPIEGVANLPDFVAGLSMIRGEPTPVVLLDSLLTGAGSPPARYVVVRAGNRRIALAVTEVLGVAALSFDALCALPPLTKAAPDAVEAIAALDADLLFVLNSANIVEDEVWQELDSDQS